MSDLVSQSVLDPQVQQCPYPYYRALREEAPVRLTPEGTYIVSTYDLIIQVVHDSKTFSSMSPHGGGLGLHHSEAADGLIEKKGYGRSLPVFVNLDPPDHTVYRRIVMNAFRPARIRQMEQSIITTVTDVMDSFADQSEVNVVHDFAIPVQIYIIADILGVARSDFRLFREWSDAWFVGLALSVSEEEHLKAAEKIVELQHYLMARIRERREKPGDDLISSLVHAEVDGDRLTDAEVAAFFVLLSVAGNDTTRQTISHTMKALTDFPDQRAWLLADYDNRISTAVEEFVRWATPVMTFRRTAATDFELGGQTITAGEKVVMFYASGNWDGEAFDHPDRFDLSRSPNPHLGFGGGGLHFCLGAHVARAQLRAIFAELLRQIPDIQAGEPTYAAGNFVHAVRSLPCTF